MQELKCPCCHGKCELKDTLKIARKMGRRWEELPYYIVCTVCHAHSGFFDTEEAAINHWTKHNKNRHKPIAGCPLCEEGSGMLLEGYNPLYRKRMYSVSCNDCGFKSGFYETADEAIDNWNGVKNDDKGPSDES